MRGYKDNIIKGHNQHHGSIGYYSDFVNNANFGIAKNFSIGLYARRICIRLKLKTARKI